MIALENNEKIVKIIHKHWFTLVPPGISLLLLLILPTVITGALRSSIHLEQDTLVLIVNFGISLYFLILTLFALIIWVDYYLDMWIITSTRIIDIEQQGLFNREIAEIPLNRIQDVTVDVDGVVRTFLKFGTIRIQTAGERGFAIQDIPDLEEVRDLIFPARSTPSPKGPIDNGGAAG